MYKKYKIKRKNKINIYLIFCILAIGLMFMSYGYALWSESLKITGKANIKKSGTEPSDPEEIGSTMNVSIMEAQNYVSPPVGFKLVSQEVVNNAVVVTLEPQGTSNVQPGIFVFYCTNNSGYSATDGTSSYKVISGDEAAVISASAPLHSTTLANGATLQFLAYIALDSSKVTTKTTLEVSITYTVNGEKQAINYYVIINPKA